MDMHGDISNSKNTDKLILSMNTSLLNKSLLHLSVWFLYFAKYSIFVMSKQWTEDIFSEEAD